MLLCCHVGKRIMSLRDAVRLAHFLRPGDLTQICIPNEAHEALRDLERARDDARRAFSTTTAVVREA